MVSRRRGSRMGYMIPAEGEVKLKVKVDVKGNKVILLIEPKKYHLERTSIRQVSPDQWSNWAMLYISLESLKKLSEAMQELPLVKRGRKFKLLLESQQGGKEQTCFLGFNGYKGIPVSDFSLCLGCFKHAFTYLLNQNLRYNYGANLNMIKLRLVYDASIPTYSKIGMAGFQGKNPQFMMKLSSWMKQITIKGILKPQIKGKARGILEKCDHKDKLQLLIFDAGLFLEVIGYWYDVITRKATNPKLENFRNKKLCGLTSNST